MSGNAASERVGEDWPAPRRAWYALGVLTVALLVATIDRSIMSLLVEPIKHDLDLTDTQMSLLIGLAFVSAYAVLGVPIARLADIHSRRLIIGLGIAFWSVMTALCGVAQTYTQLFLARVGVGAGESSFAPATYSILTDSFPKEKLPRALAVLSMGFFYGAGLAYIVGGSVVLMVEKMPAVALPWIGEIRPWQVVFFAVGLPGLLLALVMTTVHEPRRRGLMLRAQDEAPGIRRSVPIGQIRDFLGDDWKTFAPIFGAMGVKTLLLFGTSLWVPALFMRTYGWTIPQIGITQGLIMLVVSPLGLIGGSWLAERYAKRGYDDANMRVTLIATIGTLLPSVLFPLMPSAGLALLLFAANQFIASLGVGPSNAALQIITPNEMRSQVRALFQFVFNVIGYFLGPLFVALFTDYVFRDEAMLRYSLSSAAAITVPLAILVIWYGLKPYGRSVVRARAWD